MQRLTLWKRVLKEGKDPSSLLPQMMAINKQHLFACHFTHVAYNDLRMRIYILCTKPAIILFILDCTYYSQNYASIIYQGLFNGLEQSCPSRLSVFCWPVLLYRDLALHTVWINKFLRLTVTSKFSLASFPPPQWPVSLSAFAHVQYEVVTRPLFWRN